jgi:trk system potassium uptake protein TrkA
VYQLGEDRQPHHTVPSRAIQPADDPWLRGVGDPGRPFRGGVVEERALPSPFMRVLIAGGGQVGALIARRLSREGNEVTILDASPERCAELEETLDAHVVQGSASRVRTLRRAGIRDAQMLIAVTDTDEVNLLACVIAQAEAAGQQIKVARVRTHEVDEWKRVAAASGLHIDLLIHPERELAERVMRVIHLPGVSDVVDFAEGRVRLFGMQVEPGSWLAGKTLQQLQEAGPPSDSLVAMIFRGPQVIIPHGAVELREGDQLYTVATRENLHDVIRFMGLGGGGELDRVFVVGGKQLGITCAELLEKQGVSVKLFERDARRSGRIAEILDKTVVLHADGTDQTILEEENVDGVDAFLAFTNDDEDNIIASLLARRLGARKVVALINRLNYLPLAQRLGVHTTVSPRLAAADLIFQFVRKGRVMSVTTFREEEAEAIELVATERSPYVGRKLRDLRFPRGSIVGAIVGADGTTRVPRGDVEIRPGDRVIFFSLESAVPELESAFLVEGGRARS